MNVAEHPTNIEPSRSGHSIGRWESDVLVVDTVGFAPGVLNAPIMNSEQLRVVERFTLDPNAMTLAREYTISRSRIKGARRRSSNAIRPISTPTGRSTSFAAKGATRRSRGTCGSATARCTVCTRPPIGT
jgi:hypothetical protein